MKIVITTESALTALILRERIIKAVKGELKDYDIDTWSYVRSGDNYDIIYHNPTQYVDSPEKNLLFRVGLDSKEVTFTSAWWKSKPEPTKEMISLHIGRLTELLLSHFCSAFISFRVVDF